MSLRISCPACKIAITVNDDVRGRQIRCTGCSKVLAVPAAISSVQSASGEAKPAAPAAPPPIAASPPPPSVKPSVAVAKSIQKPAEAIQEAPKAIAIAAPFQKLEPGSAKPKVAGTASANPKQEADAAPSMGKKAKPKKSGLPIILLVAGGGATLFLFALIFVMIIGGYFIFRSNKKPGDGAADQQAKTKVEPKFEAEDPRNDLKPEPEPIADPNTGKLLPGEMSEEIVRRVKEATTYLRVTRQGGGVSEGSGFFAVQPGIVVTNAHVLGMLQAGTQNPIDVQVTLNSGEKNEVKLEGAVLGVDRQSDLALVRIGDSPFLPKPLLLEGERKLFETQKVYIFGFPFGAQLGANITVSPSAISSLRKNPSGGLKEIQVNGGMHPGNSGGPVVNSLGNIVGVAVSGIRGTQINFAVPAENVRMIMDGRLSETIIGEAFLQDGHPRLPMRFTCLDPLNRVRELRVDVWTGASGEPRATMNQQQQTVPGDGPHQTYKVTYRDGVGAMDVPLPPLAPGKVYWLQPSVVTARGVQWETTVPLAGPFYPLERKAANLLVSLTAQKERTVKLKSSQSFTLFKGKEKKSHAHKIETDLLEVLSPDPKGARKRTAFGPTVVSIDVDGNVTTDPQVSNVLRQIPPTFVLDGSNKLRERSDRNLNPKMQPTLRQDVVDTYSQLCNSIEAVTMPMPNRTLAPMETWQTQIPMLLRTGARVEVVDLALTCTFEGTRNRDKRSEGFISLSGMVKGRELNANKVGGNVSGKVAFDLADGYITQAVCKISSDYDIQDIQVAYSLDIHLDRSPGNPLNIPAPTDFKPGPGLNPGLVLEGRIVLKRDGALAATDPPYTNPTFQQRNARMNVHSVMLQAGKTYAVTLNSKAFDSYLVLTSPQGQVVAEDDDGAGFPNALMIYTVTQSGMYRITATAFDGQLGAYQLTVLELAAKK